MPKMNLNSKKFALLIRRCGLLPVLSIMLAGISCTQISADKKSDPKPNIIVFMVDDMGWQDTSVPFWTEKTTFNALYRTPAMERLAAEGMKFTQAYATPVCTPTRVSLISGMNAAKHRVTNWTLRRDKMMVQPPKGLKNACLEYEWRTTNRFNT